jgi:hypothetical protein
MSSAIYFDGPDFSRDRITDLTKEKSGRMYAKALLRQKWAAYLKEKNKDRQPYTKEEMQSLFHWISNTAVHTEHLKLII